jgi:hypothetical protein
MAETQIRIPGLTFGGALQVSNTTIVTAALAGVAISALIMHCLNYNHKGKHMQKEWKRHSPKAIQKQIFQDVVSFAADAHQVGQNLPAVRNVITTMNNQIRGTIDAYRRGDITAQQFDTTVRNMYPAVLEELGIPPSNVPMNITRNLDNKIDRIADRILEGQIPVKVKFRMYKNHPGLAKMHELGRERALEMGQGHKYGLHRQAMHTSAGVYLPPQSHFGSWERQYY